MINSGENMKNIIQLLKSTKIIFGILLILNLCIILYHFSNKESFHSDEQWSYAHANSSIGAFLDKDIDSHLSVEGEAKKRWYNQKISSERLVKYLTVSKEWRFNYSNIFENLSKGVHPPLYYMMHAKDIYITDDICDEKTIQDIKKTNSPIILTYMSYIPKTRKIYKSKNRLPAMKCLSDMGFEEKYKICIS